MEKVVLTRKDLFEEVWKHPLTSLAHKYAMSDCGLRKVCIKHNIPLPKSGHWSKAKFGKAPKPPKLPRGAEELEQITLVLRKEGESYVPTSNPVINKQRDIEDSGVLLELEKDFRKADPLVRTTKKFLEMKYDYRKNRDAWFAARELSIGVDTSKELQKRALLIFDRIIKVLKHRDCKVFVKSNNAFVSKFGEELDFRIREKQKASYTKDSHGWRTRTYTPTGLLIFQLEYGYWCTEWIDKKQPLENQISKIVAKIELRLEEKQQERIDREERRKQEEVEREIQAQKAAIREAELEKTKQLFVNFEIWKKAKELREYIAELEHKNHDPGYIQWAKHKIDWFDPSVQKEDSLLIEDDKAVLYNRIG